MRLEGRRGGGGGVRGVEWQQPPSALKSSEHMAVTGRVPGEGNRRGRGWRRGQREEGGGQSTPDFTPAVPEEREGGAS